MRSLSIKVELFKWSLDGVLNQKTCQRQLCYSNLFFIFLFLRKWYNNDDNNRSKDKTWWSSTFLRELLSFPRYFVFSSDRNYKSSSERRSTSSKENLTSYMLCLFIFVRSKICKMHTYKEKDKNSTLYPIYLSHQHQILNIFKLNKSECDSKIEGLSS